MCLGELFDDNLLKEMQDAFYSIAGREREKKSPIHWFNSQMPSMDGAGPSCSLELGNVTQVSHVGDKRPRTSATICCLQGCILAESWHQEWSEGWNPPILKWDVGIPSGTVTAMPLPLLLAGFQ